MGDRPEIPAETQIHVRVWGMDADAHPFSQNAVARNISGEGAQILGISHPLKTGDIIGIKHGEKKARFKVVWVTDAGTLRKIEAGVQIVEGQRTPWQEMTNGKRSRLPQAKSTGDLSGTKSSFQSRSVWRSAHT